MLLNVRLGNFVSKFECIDSNVYSYVLDYNSSIMPQVHHSMCIELWKLVERISEIFPDIEAARPRCSTGIQALCMLNRAIEKAKQLVQYCNESSKLYLVCNLR